MSKSNVGKIALSTSLTDCRALGPGRQFVLAGASATTRVSIYAAEGITNTKFVKIATLSGANAVLSFPQDSSCFLKYVVDAGSLGGGSVSVMGPLSEGGSNSVALATSATDVTKLNKGRTAYVAAGDTNIVIQILTSTASGGTYISVGQLNVAKSSGRFLSLPNDGSLFMKYVVVSPASLGPSGTPDVWVSGGEDPLYLANYVATSLGTYTVAGQVLTVTATGALGSQDGVSPQVGDTVFVPEGLTHVTAKDAGPYVISALGDTTSSAAMARPSWWQNGQNLTLDATIKVNAGTLFGGSAWKCFILSGVIGTDAPAMYPDLVVQQATLSTGAVTLTNVPIRSATKSSIRFERTTPAGTLGALYCTSGVTAGDLSTASVTMQAQTSTGAAATSDTSTGRLAIENW